MAKRGKTLEQLADQFDLDIVQIPVEDIEPDPENANEMSEALYEALVSDIKSNGFTQPVLVRPVDIGYRLIDGEHRWRAVSELGVLRIPAIVIEADDDDARLRLLTMNRFRGQLVPTREAKIIADLARRIEKSDLGSRLGMTGGQLEGSLRLANFSKGLGTRIRDKGSAPKSASRQVLRFSCSRADADQIESVIDALTDATIERGEALALVCREFERARRVEGTSVLKP